MRGVTGTLQCHAASNVCVSTHETRFHHVARAARIGAHEWEGPSMLVQRDRMRDPRPQMGDSEVVQMIVGPGDAELGDGVEKAHEAQIDAGGKMAPHGVIHAEYAVLRVCGDAIAEMASEGCSSGEADDVDGQDGAAWMLLQRGE